MKGKYITVLDFEVGRVFQYENLEHFEDGWNGNHRHDRENIEWYLTTVKGHRLNKLLMEKLNNYKVIMILQTKYE